MFRRFDGQRAKMHLQHGPRQVIRQFRLNGHGQNSDPFRSDDVTASYRIYATTAAYAPTADLSDPIIQSRLLIYQTCVSDHETTTLRSHHQRLRSRGTTAVHGYAASASKDALQCFTRYVANQVRDSNVCIVPNGPGAMPPDRVNDKDRCGLPDVELIAGRFVLASGAGLDLSGRLVTCDDGYLDAVYESPRD